MKKNNLPELHLWPTMTLNDLLEAVPELNRYAALKPGTVVDSGIEAPAYDDQCDSWWASVVYKWFTLVDLGAGLTQNDVPDVYVSGEADCDSERIFHHLKFCDINGKVDESRRCQSAAETVHLFSRWDFLLANYQFDISPDDAELHRWPAVYQFENKALRDFLYTDIALCVWG